MSTQQPEQEATGLAAERAANAREAEQRRVTDLAAAKAEKDRNAAEAKRIREVAEGNAQREAEQKAVLNKQRDADEKTAASRVLEQAGRPAWDTKAPTVPGDVPDEDPRLADPATTLCEVGWEPTGQKSFNGRPTFKAPPDHRSFFINEFAQAETVNFERKYTASEALRVFDLTNKTIAAEEKRARDAAAKRAADDRRGIMGAPRRN